MQRRRPHRGSPADPVTRMAMRCAQRVRLRRWAIASLFWKKAMDLADAELLKINSTAAMCYDLQDPLMRLRVKDKQLMLILTLIHC